MFPYLVDGDGPIYGPSNNFDVRFGMQNLADAVTHALVVVDYEHTNCVSTHSISDMLSERNRAVRPSCFFSCT